MCVGIDRFRYDPKVLSGILFPSSVTSRVRKRARLDDMNDSMEGVEEEEAPRDVVLETAKDKFLVSLAKELDEDVVPPRKYTIARITVEIPPSSPDNKPTNKEEETKPADVPAESTKPPPPTWSTPPADPMLSVLFPLGKSATPPAGGGTKPPPLKVDEKPPLKKLLARVLVTEREEGHFRFDVDEIRVEGLDVDTLGVKSWRWAAREEFVLN